MPDLQPEDAKLVTLARSARGRTGAAEGAAVRDTDGRTYLAATVSLPSLKLSALQAAVAAAVSSGVEGLEAAAIVSGADAVEQEGLAAVRDLTPSAPVHLAGPDGALRTTVKRPGPAASRGGVVTWAGTPAIDRRPVGDCPV